MSFQKEVAELGTLSQTSEDEMMQQLASIQGLRGWMLSQQTLLQLLKTPKESPLKLFNMLKDRMISLFSLIQELEDGTNLRLAWIRTIKNVADKLSSMIQSHEEGDNAIDMTRIVRETIESLLATLQKLKDFMKSLRTLVQTSKNPAKSAQISTQVLELQMEESQDLFLDLMSVTRMESVSSQVLKNALKLQSDSIRILTASVEMQIRLIRTPEIPLQLPPHRNMLELQSDLNLDLKYALTVQLNLVSILESAAQKPLDSMQILKNAVETQFHLIQALKNTKECEST